MTPTAEHAAPAKIEYKLFDVVVSRVDVPGVSGHTVAAGTPGTIVEIFEQPSLGYMVEFPEDEDMTLPVLAPDQIAPWVRPQPA